MRVVKLYDEMMVSDDAEDSAIKPSDVSEVSREWPRKTDK